MFEALQAPLFFGLIAAFVTTIGLLAVALRADWSQKHAGLFGLAAGGMLISMALLHILPEAFHLSDRAPIWLTAGFFSGLVINFTIRAAFPEREASTLPKEAITPVLAIATHSLIDGIVYAVTFAASFEAGVYTAIGLILHEFPEGVIAFAILRRHGVSNGKSFFWAFMAAALTTPIGVLISGPFMMNLGPDAIGALFALSAGLLLYVATGPLMSPLKDLPPARGLAAICSGALIAVILVFAPLPGMDHSHDLPGPDARPPLHHDHDHHDGHDHD